MGYERKFKLSLTVLIIGTFLFLTKPGYFRSTHDALFIPKPATTSKFKGRVGYYEHVYQKMLAQRKGLIEKHGPSLDKIHMFPPDVRPWPPYTAWDYFPAAFNCPHDLQRIGALGDGGKWVCGLSKLAKKNNCVIYSFGGISRDSTFESSLISRTAGCQVWTYDSSDKASAPEVPSEQAHRMHFSPFGLAGADAHESKYQTKMYTLQTLMKMNHHSFVDILKIDIESMEFSALSSIVRDYKARNQTLPFGQLQVEIHAWDKSFSEFLRWWESLEEAGLRPFWTEVNLVYMNYNRGKSADLAEYSFLNILGDHEVLSEEQSLN